MENEMIINNQDLVVNNISDIKKQADHIHAIMRDIMKKDVHYGVIPGCGNKPALLKAGAEKILMGFQLGVRYEIVDLASLAQVNSDGFYGFRVTAALFSRSSGVELGCGIGDATTREKKWKHLYAAGNSNTVLKMAKKRALVDAILTVTAASDIFTQDIDDSDVTKCGHESGKPKTEKPQADKRLSQIAAMAKEMDSSEEDKQRYNDLKKSVSIGAAFSAAMDDYLKWKKVSKTENADKLPY